MSDITKNTYKSAGVDIDEGARAVELIKARMNQSDKKNVLSGIGGFGGVIDISVLGFSQPVLVSSIDGVGTKTKIAAALGKYEGVGKDIVSHCINDIAVQGAKPLFFMDYIGVGKLKASMVDEIIGGILSVCRDEGCVLLGGETAEMPSVYTGNEFDIVGCITGIMEKDKVVVGKQVREGDIIIGLESSGLHTNGYSLARKVLFDSGKFQLDSIVAGLKIPIGEELLIPHMPYGKIIHQVCANFSVHGMAHITGGGLIDNLPRILHDNVDIYIDSKSWKPLEIFNIIQNAGCIDKQEMFRVFNMGIGMSFIVSKEEADAVFRFIGSNNYIPYVIGEVKSGSKKVIID